MIIQPMRMVRICPMDRVTSRIYTAIYTSGGSQNISKYCLSKDENTPGFYYNENMCVNTPETEGGQEDMMVHPGG